MAGERSVDVPEDNVPADEVVNSSLLEQHVDDNSLCDRRDIDHENTCSNSCSSSEEQSIDALEEDALEDALEDEDVNSSFHEIRVKNNSLRDRRNIDHKNTCSVSKKSNFDVLTEVRETVSELFPYLNQSASDDARNEFELLVKSVARFLKKKFNAINPEKSAPTASRRKHAIREIIKGMIHENYPNRAFFQLLNRWARKPKQDFSLDSFNTLVVLACNLEQSNRNLSHLLLKSRDFTIKPPRKFTRERIKVTYAASPKGQRKDHMDDAVDRIELTIRLLYSGLHTTHGIYFSQVRMNSVKTKHDLNLPSVIFLPPDLRDTGFHPTKLLPPDERNRKNTATSQHETRVSQNVDVTTRASKKLDLNPNYIDTPKCCNREKTIIAQSQTRALKSKCLDSLATVCSPKRPLQNLPDNPATTKKPRTFIDSSQKSQKTSAEPQTMPAYSFHTSSLLGYHMPQCFKQRIWRNIRTQRLGFEVVRLVFGPQLKKHSRKRVSFDEMILEFLVASTMHRKTCSVYMEFLANLCLIFANVQSLTTGYESFKKDMVLEEDKHTIPSKVARRASFPLQQKVDRVVSAYQHIINGDYRTYSIGTGRLARDKDKQLQTIRFLVFHYWLSFGVNDEMKHLVEDKVYQGSSAATRKDRKTSKTPNTHATERANSADHVVAKFADTVLPSVMLEFRRSSSHHLTTTNPGLSSIDDRSAPSSPSTTALLDPQPTTNNPDSTSIDHEKNFHTLNGLQFCPDNEISDRLSSQLFINSGHQLYCLETSTLEVYCATNLRKRKHWRQTRFIDRRVDGSTNSPGPLIANTIVTYVPSSTSEYIDGANDVLSVARSSSDIFRRNELVLKGDLMALLRHCASCGAKDDCRRDGWFARVMDFGVKPELGTIYGNKFFKTNNSCNAAQMNTIRQTLANVVDFVWLTCAEMQKEANLPPMGGNLIRHRSFGAKVAKLLGCSFSEFEAVTVTCMLLSPNAGYCKEHTDRLNDSLYAYSKTGTLNTVMVDSNNDPYMLQVICNFRKNGGSSFDPTAVIQNFRAYHQNLQSDYARAFASTSGGTFIRNPSDLTTFHLDRNVLHENKRLSANNQTRAEIISLTIGTSRVLSCSAYFHPVYQNVKRFDYEQLTEIFFFASFLNTPLVFNHSFREVFGCGGTSSMVEGHPVFALSKHMVEHFGTILAGDSTRFSPANNTFQEMFCDPNTCKKAGSQLKKVVRVLHSWMCFIDEKQALQTAKELPLWEIDQRMDQTLSDIKTVTGTQLDFSKFRLSLFTTFVSGIGLVKPGLHLHQFFFPTKGTASYKHLNKPLGDRVKMPSIIENREKDLSSSVFDTVDSKMEVISNEMKWPKHRRDVVEVHLCESVANRYLNKKDVFFRGQNIFHLKNGKPVTKKFDSVGRWEDLELEHVAIQKKKYVKELENELLGHRMSD